jgi:hypothetical protein
VAGDAHDRWFRDKVLAPLLVGFALALATALIARSGWSRHQDDQREQTAETAPSGAIGFPSSPTSPEGAESPAAIYLSQDSGPSGTVVRVSGEGFAPSERLTLGFHTDQIGVSRANDAGRFSDVSVTIPDTFDWAAPGPFTITVRGASSIRAADAPFTLTH